MGTQSTSRRTSPAWDRPGHCGLGHDRLGHAYGTGEVTPTQPLKIEAGKQYVTRLGEIVGPMRDLGTSQIYKWQGQHRGQWQCWTHDGAYWSIPHRRQSPHDLVSEAPTKWGEVADTSHHPFPAGLQVPRRYRTTAGMETGPLRFDARAVDDEFPYVGTLIFDADNVVSDQRWSTTGRHYGPPIYNIVDRIEPEPVRAPTIPIESGKRYRLRNGQTTTAMFGITSTMQNGPRFMAEVVGEPSQGHDMWAGRAKWKVDGYGVHSALDVIAVVAEPTPTIGCLNIYQKPYGIVACLYANRAEADAAHTENNRVACIENFSFTEGDGL